MPLKIVKNSDSTHNDRPFAMDECVVATRLMLDRAHPWRATVGDRRSVKRDLALFGPKRSGIRTGKSLRAGYGFFLALSRKASKTKIVVPRKPRYLQYF